LAITEKFLSTRDPPINFYIHLSFIDYFVIIKITDIINIVIKGIIIIIIIIIITVTTNHKVVNYINSK
jgi:hypothetical protein